MKDPLWLFFTTVMFGLAAWSLWRGEVRFQGEYLERENYPKQFWLFGVIMPAIAGIVGIFEAFGILG